MTKAVKLVPIILNSLGTSMARFRTLAHDKGSESGGQKSSVTVTVADEIREFLGSYTGSVTARTQLPGQLMFRTFALSSSRDKALF